LSFHIGGQAQLGEIMSVSLFRLGKEPFVTQKDIATDKGRFHFEKRYKKRQLAQRSDRRLRIPFHMDFTGIRIAPETLGLGWKH
jgi:hypothetical protein